MRATVRRISTDLCGTIKKYATSLHIDICENLHVFYLIKSYDHGKLTVNGIEKFNGVPAQLLIVNCSAKVTPASSTLGLP